MPVMRDVEPRRDGLRLGVERLQVVHPEACLLVHLVAPLDGADLEIGGRGRIVGVVVGVLGDVPEHFRIRRDYQRVGTVRHEPNSRGGVNLRVALSTFQVPSTHSKEFVNEDSTKKNSSPTNTLRRSASR